MDHGDGKRRSFVGPSDPFGSRAVTNVTRNEDDSAYVDPDAVTNVTSEGDGEKAVT
jgi:hypothetical protein